MTGSAQLFDHYASRYDEEFSSTALGTLYRERVQAHFHSYWPQEKYLLELNAGTGEDAIKLAAMGNRVLVTDISQAMLAIAKAKAAQHKLQDQLQFSPLAIEDLKKLAGSEFDGLLSNFGGLNCIVDIQSFSHAAFDVLKPGGVVVICLMGRYVPWEWAWHLRKLNFKSAFRRLKGKTIWRGASIYYPLPAQVVKAMRKSGFTCIAKESLGVLMPPPYASDFVARHIALFKKLNHVERKIASNAIALNLADHFLLVFKRNEDKSA